jgi:hypothetical protein
MPVGCRAKTEALLLRWTFLVEILGELKGVLLHLEESPLLCGCRTEVYISSSPY